MPFDSEGVFSRIHNWEDDRINDIDIASDRHDEEDDNFASGLSQCLLKSGMVSMQGPLDLGGFTLKNMADGTLGGDAVNLRQLNDKIADNSTSIKNIINSIIPIGDIKASLIDENHGSWLLCNGQEVSRSEYADLFSVIGEKFGSGNGVTTFNVPDYRGKFLRGLGGDSLENTYTTQSEGLPNITGMVRGARIGVNGSATTQGAFTTQAASYDTGADWEGGTNVTQINFDASRSNSIYGASEHVTPINMAINYFIKAKEE